MKSKATGNTNGKPMENQAKETCYYLEKPLKAKKKKRAKDARQKKNKLKNNLEQEQTKRPYAQM